MPSASKSPREPRERFAVTHDEMDAPEGAIVGGYQRSGMWWIPLREDELCPYCGGSGQRGRGDCRACYGSGAREMSESYPERLRQEKEQRVWRRLIANVLRREREERRAAKRGRSRPGSG